MNILHIDSSALGDASASRQLTARAVNSLRGGNRHAKVVYRDLAAAPLTHVTGALLQVMRAQRDADMPMDPELRAEVALTEAVLTEFLAADVIVVGAPMYNLSVPSTLKAWIDRVLQAGRTFRYGENGPQGLAGIKRVVIASTRGGPIAGKPHELTMDHQEAYLKAVFNFMGIQNVTIVRAEGTSMGEQARQTAMQGALQQMAELCAE